MDINDNYSAGPERDANQVVPVATRAQSGSLVDPNGFHGGVSPQPAIYERLYYRPEAAEFGSTLADLCKTLWAYKALLLLLLITLLATAIYAIRSIPPVYQTGADVLIGESRAGVLDVPGLLSNGEASEAAMETEMQLMRSRDAVVRVVERFKLVDDPEFNPYLRTPSLTKRVLSTVPFAPFSGDTEAHRSVDMNETESRTLDSVLDQLAVQPLGQSSVVRLSMKSADPQKAADIANAVAEIYIEGQIQRDTQESQKMAAWMDERLDELRAELAAAEAKIEQYRTEHNLFEVSGNSLVEGQLSDLTGDLGQARMARMDVESRLRQIKKSVRAGGDIVSASDVAGSSIVQALRVEQAALDREIAELSAEYGELHPKMVQLRSKQNGIAKKIAIEVDRIVADLGNQASVARANERSVRANIQRLSSQLAVSNKSEIGLRVLEREADAVRDLLQGFLLQAEKLGTFGRLQRPHARIVSAAMVPYEPTFPSKPTIIVLASVASIFAWLLLVFFREQFITGFRGGNELERAFGVSPLNVISGGKSVRQPQAIFHNAPVSDFAESMRSLYIELFRSLHEKHVQILTVISSHQKEQRSEIAVGIAAAARLADPHSSIVVVDLNFQRPKFQAYFKKLTLGLGAADFLQGDVEVDAIVQYDAESNLHVISAGTARTPGLTMQYRPMSVLLSFLRANFDTVIIDSPPLSKSSDACAICPQTDAALFVVSAGSTPRNTVKSNLLRLRRSGSHLAGVVLSGAKTTGVSA